MNDKDIFNLIECWHKRLVDLEKQNLGKVEANISHFEYVQRAKLLGETSMLADCLSELVSLVNKHNENRS